MKKLKRRVKAMTLVEMIISIAVFAVLALLLVMLGNAVEKNTRAANQLNKKVAVDGPVAEVRNIDKSYVADQNYTVRVAASPQLVTNANSDWVSGFVTIPATLCYVDEEHTNAVTTNDKGETIYVTEADAESGDFDFNYIVITVPQNTTATTTSTATTTTTTAGD